MLIRIVAILAIATSVQAQQKDPGAAFDAYTAQAFKDWGAVGLAVAVVKDGRVVFAKGYGVRELGKPASVDTSTRFSIGSTTKAMTAAALGMLVDDGKVRWRYARPTYSFRSGWIYQNVMYAAAGAVVAAASGMPWEEFIRLRVFAPLDMRGSVPTLAGTNRQPNVASPHYKVKGTVARSGA